MDSTSRREMAICRCAIGTRSPITARASGITPPAAAPERARNQNSAGSVVAKAEAASISVVSASAISMTRCLP